MRVLLFTGTLLAVIFLNSAGQVRADETAVTDPPPAASVQPDNEPENDPDIVLCTKFCCVEAGKMVCGGYQGSIPGAPPVASTNPMDPLENEQEKWHDLMEKYWNV